MIPFGPIPGTELTEYVFQLLQKNGIHTIRDVLDVDEDKLSKITNLTKNSLAKIKQELLSKHGPRPIRMSQLYLQSKKEWSVSYKTGILSLDEILKNTFSSGCLLEICGLAGIGKTQLCLTVALNFATKYDREVLYIDTKADCLGSRIYQMLKGRNVSQNEMGKIMQQIKIERTHSAEGVINILEEFLVQLESGNSDVTNVKLIIVDSLPAVWYHILSEAQRLQGKYLQTRLANLMRKLYTQHFVLFICVNLLVNVKTEESSANQCEDEINENKDSAYDVDRSSQFFEPTAEVQLKPALGKYWLSVPTMRLAMEYSIDVEHLCAENAAVRVVRVLKSCYTSTGDTCLVSITNAGVV